jgi:tetratricopeptide (TPR) repeat protein
LAPKNDRYVRLLVDICLERYDEEQLQKVLRGMGDGDDPEVLSAEKASGIGEAMRLLEKGRLDDSLLELLENIMSKKFSEATRAGVRLEREGRGTAQIYRFLGSMEKACKEWNKAAGHFKNAVILCKSDWKSMVHWANALRQEAQEMTDREEDPVSLREEAMELCQRARGVKAGAPEPSAQRAAILCTWGSWLSSVGQDPSEKLRSAIEESHRTLEKDPRGSMVLGNLAFSHIGLGEWEAKMSRDPREMYREALRLLGDESARFPRNQDLSVLSGVVQMKWADWELKSIGEDTDRRLERAIDTLAELAAKGAASSHLHENLAVAYRIRATSLISKGEDPRESLRMAMEVARKGLEEFPHSPDLFSFLGESHLLSGQWEMEHGMDPLQSLEAARVACEEGLKCEPGSPQLRINLGCAHSFRSRWEGRCGRDPESSLRSAIEAFSAAVEKLSCWVEAQRYLGASLQELGEWEARQGRDPMASLERAVAALEAVLARDPGNLEARWSLGVTYQSIGDWEAREKGSSHENYRRSLEQFDLILAKDSRYSRALSKKGITLARMGAWEEAEKAFEALLEIKPDDRQAQNNLKIVRQHKGEKPGPVSPVEF